MNEIGPIQILVVGFGQEAKLEGRVVAELERLEAAGTIRVLDLLYVRKDLESGDLLAIDVPGSELGAVAHAIRAGPLSGIRPTVIVRCGWYGNQIADGRSSNTDSRPGSAHDSPSSSLTVTSWPACTTRHSSCRPFAPGIRHRSGKTSRALNSR